MIVQLDERSIGNMLALQSQHPDVSELPWPARREAYLQTFASGFWLGCTEGGALTAFLGCAVPAVQPANFPPSQTGQLIALLVREDLRRRGLGRALVEAAFQALLERGCRHATAVAAPRQTAALWLLDSVGFRMANILTDQGQYRYLLIRDLES